MKIDKKKANLLAMAAYLIIVGCMLVNPALELLEAKLPFENAVVWETTDFVLTTYEICSFAIMAVVVIILMAIYGEIIAESHIAITSLAISFCIGCVMLGCYAEEMEMSTWAIVIILFSAAIILEWKLQTLKAYEACAALWHAFTGMLVYKEVVLWLDVPLLSFRAWLISFMIGLVLSIQTSYLRVPTKKKVKPKKVEKSDSEA